MLVSASCQIEVSNVGDLVQVNCVGHGETEETVYNFSVGAVVEESEFEVCLTRYLLLFQGLLEVSQNSHRMVWSPSRAAIYLLNLWEARENRESFELM